MILDTRPRAAVRRRPRPAERPPASSETIQGFQLLTMRPPKPIHQKSSRSRQGARTRRSHLEPDALAHERRDGVELVGQQVVDPGQHRRPSRRRTGRRRARSRRAGPRPAFWAPTWAGTPQKVSSQIDQTPSAMSSRKRPRPSHALGQDERRPAVRGGRSDLLEAVAVAVADEVEEDRRLSGSAIRRREASPRLRRIRADGFGQPEPGFPLRSLGKGMPGAGREESRAQGGLGEGAGQEIARRGSVLRPARRTRPRAVREGVRG